MRKHPFLLPTPKIRARSPRWLTGVKTRVLRYLLGPTYTYAFLIRSRLKKKKKKKPVQKKREERKKKQTINKQSNKTKQREKILMSRLLANQSVRTILDIL